MASGSAFSLYRIGGVKAIESGLLLLGNGADEVLEYFECPAAVAVAWRDHVNAILVNFRPGRRFAQIDWYGEAFAIDAAWATANLGPAAPVAAIPAPDVAPSPKRLGGAEPKDN